MKHDGTTYLNYGTTNYVNSAQRSAIFFSVRSGTKRQEVSF